jgi:hypothetical protein
MCYCHFLHVRLCRDLVSLQNFRTSKLKLI